MKPKPNETQLDCEWKLVDGNVVRNSTCQRIELLVSEYLLKVAGGGWETLYRDPEDGRYWELTYPQGEMHGGGPPRLKYLPIAEAKAKYPVLNG
jgi:hypothetical protein